MKKVFALLLAVITAVGLFACDKETTTTTTAVTTAPSLSATAYGIVHKDYVGVADIVVKAGVVEELALEEYFLPAEWAKVAVGETAPDDVVVVSGNTPTWFGKYLVIGEKHFTGTLRSTTLNINGVAYTKQTVVYAASGIPDLFVWVRSSQANMKWYVEQIEADDYFVAKADWTETTYTVTGRQGTKTEAGYWPQSETVVLGWVGNMAAIVEAVEGKVFNPDALLLKDEVTKFWSIGDSVSGATLSDMAEYYELIAKAYSLAK